MCSFLLTNLLIHNFNVINKILKRRGPDNTNIYEFKKIKFIHNLLSITGKFTIQPFVSNNIIVLFNGEIYNYLDFGNYESDGEIIIPLYLKYGNSFSKYLDGEYAISLYDFNKNILLLTTDVFSTKPLYYSINSKFGVSTYESPLKNLGLDNIFKLNPNTTIIFNMATFNIIEKFNNKSFDLDQIKINYDDLFGKFEKSILKRVNNSKKIILLLSSGLDSGCISCCLDKYNIEHTTYTIIGNEDLMILNERLKRKKKKIIINKKDFSKELTYIKENAEHFKYDFNNPTIWFCGYPFKSNTLIGSFLKIFRKKKKNDNFKDEASLGIAYILSLANKDDNKIVLSGQGADEIISDYGFLGNRVMKSRSTFGGLFPKNLKNIFPWYNFFYGSQQCFLMKEETIGGSYSMETRYPFLDFDFVQSFLSLDYKLKNECYKAPLVKYLEKIIIHILKKN